MRAKVNSVHFVKPAAPVEGDGASHGPGVDKMATLVIAIQHEIAGAGIEALLRAAAYNVVARCSHEDDLLRCSDAFRPDLVMLAEDVVEEPAKTVSQLRANNSSVAIIFLVERHDAITASDLLDLGVEGILLSGACATSLVDCVGSVHHGRKWIDPDLLRQFAVAERSSQITNSLTSREADIALLISRGLHNKQIARELHLSEGTVKMHLHHIYEKLRLSGRTQLALSMASICAQKVSVTEVAERGPKS
jgi:two-component system nitrate/nitrite response regulator NarL